MAYQVQRGEIWMYEFTRPNKPRPVLVLSANDFLRKIRQVTVAEITSTFHDSPAEVPVGMAEGLKHDSVVNLVNIHVVEQANLRHYVGALSADKLREVCRALAVAVAC